MEADSFCNPHLLNQLPSDICMVSTVLLLYRMYIPESLRHLMCTGAWSVFGSTESSQGFKVPT